jgi:hypothetical protein
MSRLLGRTVITGFAMLLLLGLVSTVQAQSGRTPSPEGASVRISNIKDGDVLPPTFIIKFEVSGMAIAPAGKNIPDTGHHHLLIDVNEIASAFQPLPMTDQILHFGGGQTETEITLPEGKHTLQLMFADWQHIPHDPVVMSKQIDITVVDETKDK